MKKIKNIAMFAAFAALWTIAAIGGTTRDETLTIPSGQTAVTNTVRVISGGAALQRISVAAGTMAAGTTNTVGVYAVDGGVDLTLYSGALASGGTATVYPRVYGGTTNEAYVVQDVKIICTLNQTNAAAIAPRVYIQSR